MPIDQHGGHVLLVVTSSLERIVSGCLVSMKNYCLLILFIMTSEAEILCPDISS